MDAGKPGGQPGFSKATPGPGSTEGKRGDALGSNGSENSITICAAQGPHLLGKSVGMISQKVDGPKSCVRWFQMKGDGGKLLYPVIPAK
ncbi:MAG: hypothetical protein BA871_05550 [Desulfuromonadales bacterium C00003096]|nr:MAG: hypothetical protein BA871_05550 [Desulfuromonadales bacterium C00003096]